MLYIQLNKDKTFNRELPSGNIEWDENNFCTVDALVFDGKAKDFNVEELTVVPEPAYNTVTQSCVRDGCEFLDGVWKQKYKVQELFKTTKERDIALALDAEAKRKASVPLSVSPRQIRQALTRVNLRDTVEAVVAQGDQDLKDWWEFSTNFERLNTQVQAMGTALGITDLQLDDLWVLASSL